MLEIHYLSEAGSGIGPVVEPVKLEDGRPPFPEEYRELFKKHPHSLRMIRQMDAEGRPGIVAGVVDPGVVAVFSFSDLGLGHLLKCVKPKAINSDFLVNKFYRTISPI